MRALNGVIILLVSLVTLFIDLYYLLIEPLLNGPRFQPNSNQYWAIALPVAVGTLVFLGTSSWIGFTMIRTKEPIRVTYEEGYHLAMEEEELSH